LFFPENYDHSSLSLVSMQVITALTSTTLIVLLFFTSGQFHLHSKQALMCLLKDPMDASNVNNLEESGHLISHLPG